MEKKTITSNPDIEKEVWNRLKDKLEKLDPSRNYSDKHLTELALKMSDYLLEKKFEDLNSDVQKVKRELNELEEVLK